MTVPSLDQLQADAQAISATGSPKVRQFALDTVAYLRSLAPAPPPMVPPYFVGDFSTGDLSQWTDTHDAQLAATPPGVQVVKCPDATVAAYMARVTVQQFSSSSTSSGDAAVLWQGNGSNSYELPYFQAGQETWNHLRFLFPDGTDARYPGVFKHSIVSEGWDIIEEWHDAASAGYSSYVGVWGSDPPCLIFRPVGGAMPSQTFGWIHQRDGGATDVPLKVNHWYESLVHFRFGTTAASGYAEWILDGVTQYAQGTPTITARTDGTVPGVAHEVGLYRGPSRTDVGTIYMAKPLVGPTRASVSA